MNSILDERFEYHNAASHTDPEAFRKRMRQRARARRAPGTINGKPVSPAALTRLERLITKLSMPRCDDHFDKAGRRCTLHKHHDSPPSYETLP